MSIDTLEFTCGRLTRIGYLDLPVPARIARPDARAGCRRALVGAAMGGW